MIAAYVRAQMGHGCREISQFGRELLPRTDRCGGDVTPGACGCHDARPPEAGRWT